MWQQVHLLTPHGSLLIGVGDPWLVFLALTVGAISKMAQSALVSFVTCHDGIGRNNVISSARVVRWDVNDDRDRSIFPFFRRFLVEKKPRQDGERWPTPTGGAPSFSVLVSFKDPSLCLTEKTAAHQTVELWIPQRLSGLIPFFRFFGRHPFNCQPSSWNDSMVHVARDLGGCCDGSRNGSTSCGVPALEDARKSTVLP